MIRILDCTLRDGGYVNNWCFGKENIKNILSNLNEANIDIIECGYIKENSDYDSNSTVYNSFYNIKPAFVDSNTLYVSMINYGEYALENIPSKTENTIDGIRIVFKKEDSFNAIEYARSIKNKGYRVFIQPMATINYSDQEILEMVELVNAFKPEAFYIVDSFGVMNRQDVIRLYYLLNNNLNEKIKIGFHAHNNLQLAFSNAQSFIEENKVRDVIIDCSVQGMGRGAGNLNTELFVKFLNDNYEGNYNIYPLLKIIDETTSLIYEKHYWGYSLPYYLSAIHNCHPNYASYLNEKNTLTIKNIEYILSEVDLMHSQKFDQKYIEKLYEDFQTSNLNDISSIKKLKNFLKHRKLLLIAPGASVQKSLERIKNEIDNTTVVISVNHIPKNLTVDYFFISNAKRLEELGCYSMERSILTSNLKVDTEKTIVVNYNELLNHVDDVSDNATLMLIKLLIRLKVESVSIAGFDGYGDFKNYTDETNNLIIPDSKKRNINSGVIKVLKNYHQHIKINWLTETFYNLENIDD